MATDAIIVLERLRCIRESDVTGGSEPYIWPAVLWIDVNTGSVEVSTPALGNARVIIKGDMRAGETANIPSSVGGVLRRRFIDEPLSTKYVILVVALWEEDETPEKAVRAGFLAFSDELRAAVQARVLDLKAASDANDQQALNQIIADIKTRVSNRVESAIRNALTRWQKIRYKAGTLNLDDVVGVAFKNVGEPAETPINLTFGADPGGQLLSYGDAGTPGNVSSPVVVGFGGWSEFKFLFAGRNAAGENRIYAVDQAARASDEYEIQGNLQVRPVRVDRCQAEVNAVKAAQSAVDGVDAEIRALQAELQHASPAEKPFIISEIKRLREEELPIVIAALEDARRALQACRERTPPIFDPGSVLTQAAD